MIKPSRLNPGDKIATISLSWGGAGEIPLRYEAGKRQLMQNFGVEVVETRHAMKSADWIAKNPEARANDLLEALVDPEIKAIFSNIGGDDSIRTLKYMDTSIIRNNPKIFLGFSDSTVTHYCFYKAGVTSFYGTSILVGFAENAGMHPYQIKDIQRTLFDNEILGAVPRNKEAWTSERLEWAEPQNQEIKRKMLPVSGWRFLQGKGKVQGEMLGGCLEVLEFLKDTDYWVRAEEWKGKIMFIETSECKMPPMNFLWILRNFAASGILQNIEGLILGRPYDDLYWKEYDDALLQVIREEEGLVDMPIITGMDFGHTCPTFTIPFGIKGEMDMDKQQFSFLENACLSD